jgi:hypothetical protein
MNLLPQELVGLHQAELLAEAEASRRSRSGDRSLRRWERARRRRIDRSGPADSASHRVTGR